MPALAASTSVPRSATAVDVPTPSNLVRRLPAELRRAASQQGFEGKPGQTLVVAGGDGPTQVLVGLGPSKDITLDRVRQAAAAYARAVSKHRTVACTLAGGAGDIPVPEAAQAAAIGMRLATYRYTEYKSKDSPVNLRRIYLVARGRGVSAAIERAVAVADAVEFARDLTNTPGGHLPPAAFVTATRRHARGTGVRVTVWDEVRIRRERLGGLLAVNQGSEHPPRFLRLSYTPADRKPKASVALVGKGITFDSGGLSLKNAAGMMQMKVDMAGAAAVVATMCALPALQAPVAVTGYIPLTDNMTGPDAQRPGDVFKARNDKTVEVLNTDAEGRLVLADALSLAAEGGHDAVIDIATLTGSASAALGTTYGALMATDDKLADRLADASERSGERLWRLPLPPEYRPQLDSNVADLRNIGTGPYGGALIAGLFLKEFAGSKPWAHIDMGLAAMSDGERGVNVKGGTGYGVRLLIETLTGW